MQGAPSSDTKGQTTPVVAQLLSRSAYHESQLQPMTMDPKVPLAVYEARNALRIAELQGAEKYASSAWSTAKATEAQMEDYLARKQKNPILTAARSATQQAEDARAIAVKAEAAERVAQAKQAEADKIAAAKAAQAAEAQRSAEAQAMAAREAQARAEAEAAKAQADAQARASRRSRRTRQSKRRKTVARTTARSTELGPANPKDTPRGLVATMADVYCLPPGNMNLLRTRIWRWPKLSGVILAHPGLKSADRRLHR